MREARKTASENRKAANAAKRNADAAFLAVKLAHQPFVEIGQRDTGPPIEVLTAGKGPFLRLHWRIYNAATIPARLQQIDWVCKTKDGPENESIGEERDTVPGPERGFDCHVDTQPLTDAQVIQLHLSPAALENAIRLLDQTAGAQRFGDIVETGLVSEGKRNS